MPAHSKNNTNTTFEYSVDKFADTQLLRYKVDHFEELAPKQKEYIYYLSEAALWGRDILFDQNGKYNLAIRRTLEKVYQLYNGDRSHIHFIKLEEYLKRVWFASGIHHHYGCDKFTPEFPAEFLKDEIYKIPAAELPTKNHQSVEEFCNTIFPILFDPAIYPKRVNQTDGEDIVTSSACNYYENISQSEAESYYAKLKRPDDASPISYGLNSRLTKEENKITEKVWKIGGLYTKALEKIIFWLEKAEKVAENVQQQAIIRKLIEFYQTGDLKAFDDYSILWVNDTASDIDFINGFIETYGDPLGMKASWEALVNYKDSESSQRTSTISQYAQWFEDQSPTDKRFKKEEVRGVSAKVITAAILAGDLYPATAIGINLPNSNWIRAVHGSKSVSISNITEAYHKASQGNGFNEEFVYSNVEKEWLEKYGHITSNLHTDLHECVGHGSGKLLPGVDPDALKAYGATIEEARADLFGLYYMADEKLVELSLLPNNEAYKAEYYSFMMNGLITQLVRIEPGSNIEEAHMRNRQLIAKWVLEKGALQRVVEIVKRNNKSYVRINNYMALRTLFGELLAEIQRIKSTGDLEAARILTETYAVKVDTSLHQEVLARYKALNLAPYKGFVNPVYTPIFDENNKITDIQVSYYEGYTEQMLRYSNTYSALPSYNT